MSKGAHNISRKSLKNRSLQLNNFPTQVLKLITKELEYNTRTTEVDMSQSFIGTEAVIDIARMIKINKSIERLDLSGTSINDEGACYIAEALKFNKTLRILNLQGNEITPLGSEYILMTLKGTNDFLQSCRVFSPIISNRTFQHELDDTLAMNYTLYKDYSEMLALKLTCYSETESEIIKVKFLDELPAEERNLSLKFCKWYQACSKGDFDMFWNATMIGDVTLDFFKLNSFIEEYITDHFFEFIGLCKYDSNNKLNRLPIDPKQVVISFLGKDCLYPPTVEDLVKDYFCPKTKDLIKYQSHQRVEDLVKDLFYQKQEPEVQSHFNSKTIIDTSHFVTDIISDYLFESCDKQEPGVQPYYSSKTIIDTSHFITDIVSDYLFESCEIPI